MLEEIVLSRVLLPPPPALAPVQRTHHTHISRRLDSPLSILLSTDRAHFMNASSTHSPVIALVSINIASFSWQNLLASRKVTCLSSFKSLLFPVATMEMSGRARVRASLSQFARCSKVSRFVMS